MYDKSRKSIRCAGLAAAMMVSTAAHAGTPNGGTITYGPPAHSIPVLSDLMLVVLGILLAVMAYRALRAHPGGRPLTAIAAVGILGLSMMPGVKFVEKAYGVFVAEMTNPSGGVVSVPTGVELPVRNATGVTQQIKAVTPPPGGISAPTTGTPTCTPGLTIKSNDPCYVLLALPPA